MGVWNVNILLKGKELLSTIYGSDFFSGKIKSSDPN